MLPRRPVIAKGDVSRETQRNTEHFDHEPGPRQSRGKRNAILPAVLPLRVTMKPEFAELAEILPQDSANPADSVLTGVIDRL
jgi:hypothetical protein